MWFFRCIRGQKVSDDSGKPGTADKERSAEPLLSRRDVRVSLGGRAIDEKCLLPQACQVIDGLVEVEITGIETDENHDLSLIDVASKAA